MNSSTTKAESPNTSATPSRATSRTSTSPSASPTTSWTPSRTARSSRSPIPERASPYRHGGDERTLRDVRLGDHVEVGAELSIPAEELWDDIVEGAHENGEPGVIYLERVNKQHSFDVEKHPDHRILATNPCGEQPLEEYEACNLGHINLSTLADLEAPDWRVWYDDHGDEYESLEAAVDAFLEEAIDFEEFDRRIEMGTRFLENVVTMSDFPVEKIEQKVREMRKIGLGIMGLAQLYIQLGMEYGSETSNEVARQLMRHINHTSKWTSHELAEERGSFDEWDKSKYANPTEYREWFEKQTGLDADDWADGFAIRNHNTTTIAPTGTTSMVGNTTGGCEPIYNVAYYKNVSDDVQGDEMLVEFDDYFLRVLEDNDIDVDAVKEEAKEQMATNQFDGVEGLSTVPDAIGELFVTTGDLSAKEHAASRSPVRKASTPRSRRRSTRPTTPRSRTPKTCSSTFTNTAARASPTTATAPAANRC